MLQPDIMNVAFASRGQKTYPIPSGTSFGNASLTAGFPPETSNPLLDGGVPPKRTDILAFRFCHVSTERWEIYVLYGNQL